MSKQELEHLLLSVTPQNMDDFSAMMSHMDTGALIASLDAGQHLTAALGASPDGPPPAQLWPSAESALDQSMGQFYQELDEFPQNNDTSTQHHVLPEPNISHSSNQASATTESEKSTQFICWDHGCRGRVFTNYSNLRRHCREQSETPEKTTCERCGQQFSRPAAKARHQDRGRCKKSATTRHHAPVLLSRDGAPTGL
jgi:hypothetical protein